MASRGKKQQQQDVSPEDTYRDENIIQDPEYIESVLHGKEEFKPEDPDKAQPRSRDDYDMRKSSFTKEGVFYEAEGGGEGETGETVELEEEKDTQRRLSALVAASHRMERTRADRRDSALKASLLFRELTGEDLEIDEEGRVVTGERVMK